MAGIGEGINNEKNPDDRSRDIEARFKKMSDYALVLLIRTVVTNQFQAVRNMMPPGTFRIAVREALGRNLFVAGLPNEPYVADMPPAQMNGKPDVLASDRQQALKSLRIPNAKLLESIQKLAADDTKKNDNDLIALVKIAIDRNMLPQPAVPPTDGVPAPMNK